jgi:hypothetical protein
MNLPISIKKARGVAALPTAGRFMACLLVLLLGLTQVPAHAEDVAVEKQELLRAQARLVWSRVNEARADLRGTIERLGLDADQVAASLGDNAWVLDAGLPPLAWNDELTSSAETHGRDMATQLYYSYQSLDGRTVADRVAETGYAAAQADEALAILAFSTYVGLEEAVGFMVDNLLRDELLSLPHGRLALLSPFLSEMGIGLLAENLQLVMGQQYVYLLVADFAVPAETRSWLVGCVPEGYYAGLRNGYTGFWEIVEVDDHGFFQQLLGAKGWELDIYLLDESYNTLDVRGVVLQPGLNLYVDFRSE